MTTQTLVVNGSEVILVEVKDVQLVSVAEQGPPGPQGLDGAGANFVADPLAYYILAKA